MTKKETIKRLFSYLKKHTAGWVAAILCNAVNVVATLLIPVRVGTAIDCILGEGAVDFAAIKGTLLQLLLLAAAAAASQWAASVIHNRIAFHTVERIRHDAFAKLHTLDLAYLDSHPSGDTLSRILSDTERLSDGLLLGFSRLFTGAATILGTLFFMLKLHKGITLVVVLLTPVSIFAARFISSRTYRMFRRQTEINGKQTALTDEILSSRNVVKAFGTEKKMLSQLDEINGKNRESSLKAVFYSSLTNPCTRFVNSLVYAAVALTGALSAISGGMITVGTLSCFLSYANQYTKPFNEISGVITEFQNALACAGRIFTFLSEPPQTPEDENAAGLNEPTGDVVFQNVSFSYDKQRPVLQDIRLAVKGGQHIAIVGPTGCGKTTLIHLLMRFYDADSGTLTIDGKDITTLTRQSLRRSIGMVLQDTWLKAGTAAENIAFGRPDATRDEIVRAAKLAHAHGFIERLPDGYDTLLGENGEGLSQGEKQLLCIARVMLCLPPMLILDEATSGIDTRTELKIADGFAALMKGRTTFIVAHRLSTVVSSDLILVMKDGRIIEQGTHEELLKQGGAYAGMWEKS